MADDEVVEAEGQEEVENKPPRDTTKTFIVVLVGLSILLMVLTPLVTILLVKEMVPQVNVDEPDSIDDETTAVEYVIEGVQCNLAGTQGKRYIRLDVAFLLSDKKIEPLFNPPPKEGEPLIIPSKRNRILSKLIEIIANKQMTQLETTDDKESLANNIRDSINDLLSADVKKLKIVDGRVDEVYFPKFLIQ